ncbi:MAG: alpha/beta hydrolase [Chitinophagaceae bacterium]|nr:MAG: alpha/beta hydrolase [Chitinophagaceae bacterium]
MKIQQKLAIHFIKNKITLLTLLNKRSGGKEAFRLFCTPLTRYKGKKAEVFENGNALTLNLHGLTIRGYECNPTGVKTILILHGFSSSCHKFDKYALALIEKNYRVLAFDAPAHGFSDGTMVNALDYSNMIQEVIKTYGPVDGFIAHSFGGIAVSLALEKIGHDPAVRLVLIAPATETSSAIEGALKLLRITNPRVRLALDEHIYMVGNQPTEWYSVRRAMKQINARVLWIHDEDDDITPLSDALKVKEDNNPNIEFVITRGLGHQRIYKDPSVKKRILDFL